jgi:hypothetical protein
MRLSRITFILFLLFPFTNLFSQQIVRDYNHSVDFSSLKKYAWIEREEISIFNAGVPENMRHGDYAEWDRKIHEAVDKELQKKKFQKVPAESADFFVSYILVTKLDMDVQEYDSSVGSDPRVPYGHWRPFHNTSNDVLMKREGTLTLDMVNPENNELIWRGRAVESVKEKDSDKKAWKKIEGAIKKTLSKFPPKK